MSDNTCMCWCGRAWSACLTPNNRAKCLRELRERNAEDGFVNLNKPPSALAPRRKPKVSLAEIAEAFDRNKEGL